MNNFLFLNVMFSVVGAVVALVGLGMSIGGDDEGGMIVAMVGFASIATSLLFHKK